MGLGRARTMGAKALLIHPSHQGVWAMTENCEPMTEKRFLQRSCFDL